jgi:histidinol-phosphatase (PHP family)
VYEEYFNMFCAAAESHMFDSISHIDFIWRYVRWPENKTGKIYEMIDNAVKCAVGADVAVEINSNGYLWSRLYKVDEGDPFDVLLESIKKHGANITIGSDAHKPEFVGKSFDGISEALTEHGIRQYCTFLGRNRTAVLIS